LVETKTDGKNHEGKKARDKIEKKDGKSIFKGGGGGGKCVTEGKSFTGIHAKQHLR